MTINISRLKKELYYHPGWEDDRHIFLRLLRQSSFSDKDITSAARLYVKYSHIHCFHETQLTIYFKHMLQKMQINGAQELFTRANNIYRAKENML